jgi:hypothetical protein
MVRIWVVAFALASAWSLAKDQTKTDDEIKQQLIKESIAGRNLVRLPSGISVQLRRNPHLPEDIHYQSD